MPCAAERRAAVSPLRIGAALAAILALEPTSMPSPSMWHAASSAPAPWLVGYDSLYIELRCAASRTGHLRCRDDRRRAACGIRLFPNLQGLAA